MALLQLSQTLVPHRTFVKRDLTTCTSRVPPPTSDGVHGFWQPRSSGYDRGESSGGSCARHTKPHPFRSCGRIFYGSSSKFHAVGLDKLVSPYGFHLIIVLCIIIEQFDFLKE